MMGPVGIEADLNTDALCQEFVNRSGLVEFQYSSDDCETANFNGCYKLVTKYYHYMSHLGHRELTFVVVTRNCAEIPPTVSPGCYTTTGGAGLEREMCFCKGNYCNAARRLHISLVLSTVFLMNVFQLTM